MRYPRRIAYWVVAFLGLLINLACLVGGHDLSWAGLRAYMAQPPVLVGSVTAFIVLFAVLGYVLVLYDDLCMSERAIAQAAQRDAALLQALLDNIPDAIYFKDRDHKFIAASQAQADHRRVTPEDMVGKTDVDFEDEATAKQSLADERQIMETGEPVVGKVEHISRSDGSQYWYSVTKVPYYDGDGEVAGIVGISRDITERKQAEEERHSLEQQLFRSQRLESLGTLAGGVAHDFNNSLSGIIGMAELALKHTARDSKAYEYLATVPEQGKRAGELIASLMAFSRRTTSGQGPLTLLPLLKETGKVLQSTLPETITVRMIWPEYLPRVNADPTQIQQVIMNLATNARDAMPDGGELTVEVAETSLDQQYSRQRLDAAPGDYVCLSVQDTGIGMTPEVQEHIFEPFFTTKEKGEGTGLGLATVYGIVKNHNGFIHCYSEVGEGTRFSFYLPVSDGQMPDREQYGEQGPPQGTETILVVEDDPTVLTTARSMLESLGYTVLTATNGVEAVEVYRADRPVLVLTDVTMPKMSGDKLYLALRNLNPSVKTIVMSGYRLETEISTLKEYGVKAFVQKPLDLQKLAKVIRQTLDE